MKKIAKLIKYVLPYKYQAILNVLCNFLSSLFSLFSMGMTIPFLGILFKNQPLVTSAPPLALNSDALQANFNYYISKLILEYGEGQALMVICILAVSMTLMKTFFKYFANFFITPIRNGVIRDFRNRIYNKILTLPLGFFSETKKGDIMARMSSDVQEVDWSIMSSLEMIFRNPLTIAIYISFLIFLSPSLTLFVFVLLPVSGFIIGAIGKNLRKASKKSQNELGVILSNIEETLSGFRIIKAFNAEGKVMERFSSINNKYTRIMNRVFRRRYLASPLSELLGTISVVIIMFYGGFKILNGETTMSSQAFIGYLVVFSQVITPAKAFSTAYYNVQRGMASIDRINAILKARNDIQEKPDALTKKDFNSAIEFNDVTFRYEDTDVLKNIQLKIEHGKTIAIVGQSGSGKSTLVDLLPRFYDVQQGEILIDNIPITDIRIADLRELMGNVNQDPILFNDTIYNNIAFGGDDFTEQDVINAAKIANAHEFISQTPKGYHTIIGDRGIKLSGGQRQRISIARAVLKNPPILILDEATSALDTESERLVQEALDNLMKNRTSIVIAHRLSTVKHADEIIVLNEGEIVERGKHQQLLTLKGTYKKLHDLQMI